MTPTEVDVVEGNGRLGVRQNDALRGFLEHRLGTSPAQRLPYSKAMGDRLTLALEPGVSAAVGCGTFCAVYRGADHESYPRRVLEWSRQAVDALGVAAVPMIVVIEEQAGAPDTQGRRAYADAIRHLAPQVECTAYVILATGLKGGAFRAISSTILLLARHPTESKVFGTVEDAARWIAVHSSVCTVTPEVLITFINSVRSA